MISTDKLDTIRILYNKGLSNRDIGKILQLHHTAVTSHLKTLGLEPTFGNSPIDKVSDTKARCNDCGDIKHIGEFQKGRRGTDREYTFSFCNDCRRKRTYHNLNKDPRTFLFDRHNRLMRRCKEEGIPCTITRQEFVEQFFKQNGLCFYTDVPLKCEVGSKLHRDSLSVDKLIPERGYCFGNTVFTTHRINTCKCDLTLDEIRQWMPNWYQRISLFIGADMNDSLWRKERLDKIIDLANLNFSTGSLSSVHAVSIPLTNDELDSIRTAFPTTEVTQGKFATNSEQTSVLISSKFKPGDYAQLLVAHGTHSPGEIFTVTDIGLKVVSYDDTAVGPQHTVNMVLAMSAELEKRGQQKFWVPFNKIVRL